MPLSWRVITSSSAAVSSRRLSFATQRTSSAVSDISLLFPLDRRHLERLAARRPLDLATANTGNAHAHRFHGAADLALKSLQVGLEGPPAAAGHFPPNAAQVFCLASPSILIAENRLLAAHVALHAHDANLPCRMGFPTTGKS